MGTELGAVRCAGCDRVLAEPFNLDPGKREPCPKCGSLNRKREVIMEANLKLEGHLKTRHRSKRGPGKGGWDYEEIRGDDFNAGEGVWKRIRQVVDRVSDWYEKDVVGPDGTVERHVREPLTKHTGRGAAKR